MKQYNGIELGPLMPEDADFLRSIIEMTNPKTVVEFGHFWGHSAKAMLEVMDEDARLYSYDNTKDSAIKDSRFKFFQKCQTEIEGIHNIDFVFLDASHDLELNKKTFLKIKDELSEKAIIAVHDTGTWCDGNVFESTMGIELPDGSFVHCPDEIEFINWLQDEYPDFQQIHFHSDTKIRHGITLLQRYTRL